MKHEKLLEFEGDMEDVQMFLDVIYSLNVVFPYDDVKITELN